MLLFAAVVTTAHAGVVVYEEGSKKIELGGRIQLHYEATEPDCPAGQSCIINTSLDTSDSTIDALDFRRLRPYVAGTVTEKWFGKIELELGQASGADEVQVKDAYMVYSGLGEGLKLTIGNSKPPFSREFLTSSTKLQMIERTFVGDHNFGSPDRALGVKLTGSGLDDRIGFGAMVGAAAHDPDTNRMDFDTPVNDQGDWNEGYLVAGRVDFHPLGEVKFQQADFPRDGFRFVFGLAGFYWTNDGDNDTFTDPDTGLTEPQDPTRTVKADLDRSVGVELSAALRGRGLSVDAAYHRVDGDTVDPSFTGGLYRDGSTELDLMAVTAGYMVLDDRLELAGSWDSLDADGYADDYERTRFGVNVYLDEHKLKLQLNYGFTKSFLGRPDQDQNVFEGMMQFVF